MNAYQKENQYKAMSGRPGKFTADGFIPEDSEKQADNSTACIGIAVVLTGFILVIVLAVLSIM